jgi:RimJ/RimL family protein N-acetyltransferase
LAPSLGCSKLTVEIMGTNERSKRFFERFGFGLEGVRRGQFRVGDTCVDEVLLAAWLQDDRTSCVGEEV